MTEARVKNLSFFCSYSVVTDFRRLTYVFREFGARAHSAILPMLAVVAAPVAAQDLTEAEETALIENTEHALRLGDHCASIMLRGVPVPATRDYTMTAAEFGPGFATMSIDYPAPFGAEPSALEVQFEDDGSQITVSCDAQMDLSGPALVHVMEALWRQQQGRGVLLWGMRPDAPPTVLSTESCLTDFPEAFWVTQWEVTFVHVAEPEHLAVRFYGTSGEDWNYGCMEAR